MNLVSLRIITDDPKRLVHFYEQLTGISAEWSTEDFAELVTPSCTLAIAGVSTMNLFGAGVVRPADNHSAIIEFLVDDVDQEYARLEALISDLVQPPTTMPWGNRSLLFRDPDGQLINLFTPISEAAIQKFNRRSGLGS